MGRSTQEPAEMPPILVTGGSGFCGRSLVRALIAAGRSVRVLSRRDGPVQFPQASTYRGDVTCRDDLKAALQGCDAVFHCAAEKYDAERMATVNIGGTRNIVDLANELRVKFFCHMSSVGVTGKTSLKVVTEESLCNPTNRYEETKLAAEQIVGCGIEGGSSVILRPTNIFGSATLRPLLAKSIRDRAARLLKGNENAHLVYVEDVAAAALHCWQRSAKNPVDVFIVSSDEDGGVTYAEVQAVLAELIPAAPRRLRMAAPQVIPYWIRRMQSKNPNRGDIIYSSRKLRETGFRFPYGLRAGLTHAAATLRDAPVGSG